MQPSSGTTSKLVVLPSSSPSTPTFTNSTYQSGIPTPVDNIISNDITSTPTSNSSKNLIHNKPLDVHLSSSPKNQIIELQDISITNNNIRNNNTSNMNNINNNNIVTSPTSQEENSHAIVQINTIPNNNNNIIKTSSTANTHQTNTMMIENNMTVINPYSPTIENNPNDEPNSYSNNFNNRFKRLISQMFGKSSCFCGYRFTNFPGLRAHSSIKDPYERLSVAYYSVYFVFHLFFSITMIIQQLIRFKTLSLLYILDSAFSLIGFIMFRSPFPFAFLYVFLVYIIVTPYILISLSTASIETNSILTLILYQSTKYQTYTHLITSSCFRLILFPSAFAAIGCSSIKTLTVIIICYGLSFLQFAWLSPFLQTTSENISFGDYFCDILFQSIPFEVILLILNSMHQAFRSQIREVEQRLSNMLNITNEAIIIQSRRKKKIIYVNSSFEKMFGYSNEEIVSANKSILDLLVGPPSITTDIWNLCKARTKLGDRFGVEVTHKVDYFNAKKVDVYIIRNNELNDQVRLMNEKARQAQIELQSRTTFFSMISHDLKNPLNSIYLIAQKMHDDFQNQQGIDPHEGLEWMNMILSSCHILSNIVSDILSSSKLEAGNVELEEANFDLQYSIEEIVSINSVPAFKKGLDVGLEIDIKKESMHRVPIVVRGDVHKFQQILTNLLGNAIKFTHTGSVCVSVEIQEERDDAVKVFVSVCDTGIGIPKEKQGDLFKIFSRLKKDKEYEGCGLGLSICKNLTNLMGGDIGCHSNGVAGSNFWFTVEFQKAFTNSEDFDKLIERAERRFPLTSKNNLTEVRERFHKVYGDSYCLVIYKESKIRGILSNYVREITNDGVICLEAVDGTFDNADKLEHVLEEFLHGHNVSSIHEWKVKKPITVITLDDSCFLPENLPKSENALFTNTVISQASSSTGRRSSSVIYSPIEMERIHSTIIRLKEVVENHNAKLTTLQPSINPSFYKLIVWFDKFEPKRFLSFLRNPIEDRTMTARPNNRLIFDCTVRKPVTLFSFQYMIQQLLSSKVQSTQTGSIQIDRAALGTYTFPPPSEKITSSPNGENNNNNTPSPIIAVSHMPNSSILTNSGDSLVNSSLHRITEEKDIYIKILVADDTDMNRTILCKLLGNLSSNQELLSFTNELFGSNCRINIETFSAVDGQEALDIYIRFLEQSNGRNMDIVFLDMHMPRMDGLECSKRIREYEKNRNIIDEKEVSLIYAVTGADNVEKECKQSGMNGVIPKPVKPKILVDLMKTIIDKRYYQPSQLGFETNNK
ncbi:hypothetical protein ABK040_015132 [Willaertia magna]